MNDEQIEKQAKLAATGNKLLANGSTNILFKAEETDEGGNVHSHVKDRAIAELKPSRTIASMNGQNFEAKDCKERSLTSTHRR